MEEMGKDERKEISRRSTLKGMAGVVSLGFLPGVNARETVRFKLSNVGSRAWTVDSDPMSLTEEGTENPIITLRIGRVYRFHNNRWEEHPFEFYDANGDVLLSQDVDTSGSIENDPDTRWELERDQFRFRISDAFASRVHSYGCANHDNMEGGVRLDFVSERERRRRERREERGTDTERGSREEETDAERGTQSVDDRDTPVDDGEERAEPRGRREPREEVPEHVEQYELPDRRHRGRSGEAPDDVAESARNGTDSAVGNESGDMTQNNRSTGTVVEEDNQTEERDLFEHLMDIVE